MSEQEDLGPIMGAGLDQDQDEREKEINAQLELLTTEETALLEFAQRLKDTLVQVSKQGGMKLEEIKELTKKIEELKNGRKLASPARLSKNVLNENGVDKVQNFEKEKDAEEILPEEVWELVFGAVSDPNDLWNVCNTCPLFDKILYNWKSGWMLAQSLSYIYKDLSGNKLLECRLVSKSWKGAIDNFLENHPSTRPHNSDNASEGIDPRKVNYVNPMIEKRLKRNHFTFCNFRNPSTLEDPLPQTVCKTLGTGPFVGRYVCLSLDDFVPSKENEIEDVQKFMEKLFQYLTRFGKEIWNLSVWLPGIQGHAEMMPLVHRRILQFVTVDMFPLLPNLRDLGLVMGSTEGNVYPFPKIAALPPAPNLETLQVSYIYNPNDPLVGILMQRYHTQIRKLYTSALSSSFPDLCRLEWPNLVELHLVSIAGPWFICGVCGDQMPQLRKLGLSLVDIQDDSIWDEIFYQICMLSPKIRLDTLRLEQGPVWLKFGRGQSSPTSARLPPIKTLEVDLGHLEWEEKKGTPPSFTFLLKYFPFVENVHLFWKKNYELSEAEIDLLPREECLELAEENGFQDAFEIVEINKYVYRGQMYKSNIWELLHHLKVFTFQWDVYTKEGYEEYQERCQIHSAKTKDLPIELSD